MKTIGLLGGMTWHSTIEYYRLINTAVHERLGGSHSAQCVLCSVDFDEFEKLQNGGEWDALSRLMVKGAVSVERAGADFLVICANTMHRTAPAVEAAISIPLLHITDAVAAQIRKQGLQTVGLLGTRFTMEQDFYRERLEKKHCLKVLIPDDAGRKQVNDIIYQELGHGIISDGSRQIYLSVIRKLHAAGAQGIVLGCTEIPLLIGQGDYPLPLFDSTAIHAAAAVEQAF